MDSSLGGGILSEKSKQDETTRDNFILLGASILKEVGGALSPLAAKVGMDVINLSVGGRVMDKVDVENLPGAWKLGDILVVHPFGNYSLSISDFFYSKNKWHLVNPQFLSDLEISELIEKVAHFLSPVIKSFKGRIFLLAPFLCLLSPCCPDPSHSIKDPIHHMNITQYYILLGRYLQLHPQLRLANTEVINYPAMLPKPLTPCCFRDGIHLTASSSAVLANCIRQLAIRKTSLCPALEKPVLLFSDWVKSVTSTPNTVYAPENTTVNNTTDSSNTDNTGSAPENSTGDSNMELDITTDSLEEVCRDFSKADMI